jgi:hypothetical protein
VLAVDMALGHAQVEHFEPLLALAVADDLADALPSTTGNVVC